MKGQHIKSSPFYYAFANGAPPGPQLFNMLQLLTNRYRYEVLPVYTLVHTNTFHQLKYTVSVNRITFVSNIT